MRHLLGTVMVMSVLAGHAYAQSGDSSAIAEQLFIQARDLTKANQWAEACPKFEASLRYDPVLGTRLNLAMCYERIGKLVSAWSIYRDSIELAKKAGDAKRYDYAQRQAAALELRLPKLAISAPAKPPGGFVVTRDGTRVDAGALGVALYVDPGTHQITASAPGFEAFTQDITLGEGNAETLVIPELKVVASRVPPKPSSEHHVVTPQPVVAQAATRTKVATPEPVVAQAASRTSVATPQPGVVQSVTRTTAATPEPVVAQSASRTKVATLEPVVAQSASRTKVTTSEPVVAPSPTRKYVAIGAGAVGVAAVGIGLLFGAKANSTYRDVKTLCGARLVCSPGDDYERGKQLLHDARSSATISTVLVTAGGAAIVAGVVMFLTAPHARERTTARIVPVTQDRGAGLAVIGRF